MRPLERIYGGPKELLEKAKRDKAALFVALDDWDNTEIQDNLFNFSLSVYHIVDWIKEYHPDLKESVYDWLNTHEELRVFRDLGNASKHVSLELDRGPYKEHPPVVEEIEASARASDVIKGIGPKFRLKIQTEGGTRLTANEWADKAIAAWVEYFKIHTGSLSA
jgi:hypothetical protein